MQMQLRSRVTERANSPMILKVRPVLYPSCLIYFLCDLMFASTLFQDDALPMRRSTSEGFAVPWNSIFGDPDEVDSDQSGRTLQEAPTSNLLEQFPGRLYVIHKFELNHW